MTEEVKVQTLEALLAASQATPEFKDAVRSLERGENQELIEYNWGAPPVKVLRVMAKLLETYPEEPIEKIHLKGVSGCSTFTGTVQVEPGARQISFDWDCCWRAEQMGWRDFFGDPDQIRAAHALGYQCFRSFTEVPAAIRRVG